MTRPGSNVFDLSHDVKLSFNMGQLIPIMCTECVPGDKMNISCEALLRFQPMVTPPMHRFDCTMHYFFVPNRILWDGWEDFITGTSTAMFPYVNIDSSSYTALCDYLGLPRPIGTELESVSALPLVAYQKIYNEYYRDQNLCPEVPVKAITGLNPTPDFSQLRKRAWEHDYFTAALPFAQKGAPVSLPLGTFDDIGVLVNDQVNPGFLGQLQSAIGPPDASISVGTPSPAALPGNPGFYAETSNLNLAAATINDLRTAFRLQEWLEKNARGGTRYTESILAHFGVKSSDKRLQRPEYITGTKSPVIISEVLATADTGSVPQGNMSGHGISVTEGKYGNFYCEEHGYIIGILSVLPKTAYQQGIPKHFLKRLNPYQYFFPSFANLGEQAVENREIYAFQAAGAGSETFGYVPRYAEYKFEPSRVAGDFRTTLDFWHAGRIFATPPLLNQDFIEMDSTAVDRIFAVTDPAEQKMLCHCFNKVRATRLMPKFGTPTF